MYNLFVTSSYILTLEPEYDFKEESKKQENEHRSVSGRLYKYRHGRYDKFSFGLRYVNSETASTINAWWDNNTKLLFVQSGSLDVSSVVITNSSLPIGETEPPYSDLFTGTVELETY